MATKDWFTNKGQIIATVGTYLGLIFAIFLFAYNNWDTLKSLDFSSPMVILRYVVTVLSLLALGALGYRTRFPLNRPPRTG